MQFSRWQKELGLRQQGLAFDERQAIWISDLLKKQPKSQLQVTANLTPDEIMQHLIQSQIRINRNEKSEPTQSPPSPASSSTSSSSAAETTESAPSCQLEVSSLKEQLSAAKESSEQQKGICSHQLGEKDREIKESINEIERLKAIETMLMHDLKGCNERLAAMTPMDIHRTIQEANQRYEGEAARSRLQEEQIKNLEMIIKQFQQHTQNEHTAVAPSIPSHPLNDDFIASILSEYVFDVRPVGYSRCIIFVSI